MVEHHAESVPARDLPLPGRILVVVRDRPSALELAPALAGTDLALEITSSIDGYVDLIGELSADKALRVIAGTITDVAAARAVVDAGAQALVSPHVVPELPGAVTVPTILGAMTPTEVIAAAESGATAVKIFPVSAVGGPSYLRALRGPYPLLRLVPSGGIHPDDVAAYFDAGAEAVALGSRSLTSDGDPARLVKVLQGVVDQL